MVTPDLNQDGFTGNILIEPNRPIRWSDNLRFIRVFAMLSLLIALLFMTNGFFLVLPFSGLEVLCLTLALYLVYRRYSICQVIYFTSDSVIIESGHDHADERIEYPRYWSKFHIESPEHGGIPRLTIRSSGKTTEIGKFLSYQDKLRLISLIQELTLRFQQHLPGGSSAV